jgi:hypothetical protein
MSGHARPTYSSDPRERALQLVAEGKIGGPGRGQGRKRKPTAAEHVATVARQERQRIAAAYLDALDEGQPARVRLEAARRLLEAEERLAEREDRHGQRERFDVDGMYWSTLSDDALVEEYARMRATIPQWALADPELVALTERARASLDLPEGDVVEEVADEN